jgi:adenine-specific DNA-methyltransferase
VSTWSSRASPYTWTNKDKTLLAHEEGNYEWVEPADYRVNEVRLLHQVATVGDLSSLTESAGDNLLIRGDALHALTALNQLPQYAKEYAGKVKLVYIDPPFNTGQAFAHYDDALEHSVWLTMFRDRIRQIKPLLSEEGTVWVHLDDVEAHRARLVLDEEFGPECFVAEVAWRSTDSSSNNAKGFAKDHNSILVYGSHPGWRPNQLLDPAKSHHYSNPNIDPRGPWYDGRDVQNPKIRTNLMYVVEAPNGNLVSHPKNGWRWSRETLEEKLATGELFFNESQTAIKRIAYLWEQEGLPPSDLWFNIGATGSSAGAKNHLKALFPGILTPDLFDTPKPELLMKRILELATRPGDIVLDCFAGSGTTPAVAHKMGRRWVASEWSAQTVADFTLPRLQKVIAGEDPGGITSLTTTTIVGDIPDGLSVEDVKTAVRVLGALLEHGTFSTLDLKSTVHKFAVLSPKGKGGQAQRPGGGTHDALRLARLAARRSMVVCSALI